MATLLATKTPAEVKDYTLDWCLDLAGDTITGTPTWVASAPDLVITSPPPTNTATTATVWLSGGTPGNFYSVTNTITTAGGRTFQESFTVQCVAQRFVAT